MKSEEKPSSRKSLDFESMGNPHRSFYNQGFSLYHTFTTVDYLRRIHATDCFKFHPKNFPGS
ncbi:MAG TPA: hypothetical protein VHY08_06210, partial [Bacillota bacterium]|nr:hypothetical protein [Bacillota bacterium]